MLAVDGEPEPFLPLPRPAHHVENACSSLLSNRTRHRTAQRSQTSAHAPRLRGPDLAGESRGDGDKVIGGARYCDME